MTKVLIVGQNPSKYNFHPEIPFAGSRSETRLMMWVSELKITDYKVINVTSKVGKITSADINYDVLKSHTVGVTKIIALGRIASRALYKIGVAHFALPHLSLKNVNLNGKDFQQEQLTRCKEYLKS